MEILTQLFRAIGDNVSIDTPFHSIVPRKLAILIARGIGTRPIGAIFCIIS